MQVLDFWKDIFRYILKYSMWIIVLFLPVIVLLSFGYKYFTFAKTKWLTRFILVFCIALTQTLGVSIVRVSGEESLSAYDLYYNTSLPKQSTQRLGLLTTMRLDLQRLLTNWSPELEENPLVTTQKESDIHEKTTLNTKKNELEAVDKKVEYNTLDIDFEE